MRWFEVGKYGDGVEFMLMLLIELLIRGDYIEDSDMGCQDCDSRTWSWIQLEMMKMNVC